MYSFVLVFSSILRSVDVASFSRATSRMSDDSRHIDFFFSSSETLSLRSASDNAACSDASFPSRVLRRSLASAERELQEYLGVGFRDGFGGGGTRTQGVGIPSGEGGEGGDQIGGVDSAELESAQADGQLPAGDVDRRGTGAPPRSACRTGCWGSAGA